MLLEREAELDVAQGALREAATGRGQVLVVDGPAGIGKTSLLQAIGAAAAPAGFEVLLARGDDLESAFAYEVLGSSSRPHSCDWTRRCVPTSSKARRRPLPPSWKAPRTTLPRALVLTG